MRILAQINTFVMGVQHVQDSKIRYRMRTRHGDDALPEDRIR
jgi:hypothetical protein